MNNPLTPRLPRPPLTRRELLGRIGKSAGGAAMLHAMTALGFAAESPYRGPLSLQGAPKGASVLVLGAGMAGLVGGHRVATGRLWRPSRRR